MEEHKGLFKFLVAQVDQVKKKLNAIYFFLTKVRLGNREYKERGL